jgi:hypothetical protein
MRPRARCDTCNAMVAVHPNGTLYAHTNRDRASFGGTYGGGFRLQSSACHGKAVAVPTRDAGGAP